ncbi:VanZ family protein [Turicibacter bilis]|uniref:VanZ family protein n=1 Tax=Turicibacter bilis TaxID=2735723 RepID=A0A9Q9CR95_9FIRM|nr:VanZ family protein [Turicibacter bilis]MBS3198678.1 VanZ family protein [Turicibacter bilis]UUF08303.1 VanZ family protein [Turicibacter bilis]
MKRVWIILVVGWICFIFYQGMQVGEVSMDKSNRVVTQMMRMMDWWEEAFQKKEEPIMENVIERSEATSSSQLPIHSKVQLQKNLSYFVRKAAHFTEYFMLAVLLFLMFRTFNVSLWNQGIYSLFLVLLCAVLDEYFQSFVFRTSSVSDVMLDFCSGLFGVAVLLGVTRYNQRKSTI